MTPFAVAVERRQWDIVTLRLLIAVSDAAHRLPPQSLAELIDLLAGEAPTKERRRGR